MDNTDRNKQNVSAMLDGMRRVLADLGMLDWRESDQDESLREKIDDMEIQYGNITNVPEATDHVQ